MKTTTDLPSALREFASIQHKFRGRKLVLFLDFDGTLTPIVSRPEHALLSDSMRNVLSRLAKRYQIAVISGRGLEDIQKKIGIEGIFYAGSHGFEIEGPNGIQKELPEAHHALPSLKKAKQELDELAEKFDGAQIENKRFSIAIHYRRIEHSEKKEAFKQHAEKICRKYHDLKYEYGKQLIDLGPNIDWNKGKALEWILEKLFTNGTAFSIYIGDDVTDEYAFKVLDDNGIGIIVKEEPRLTHARYVLEHPEEVEAFLTKIEQLHE